jgi:hypothetical protein
MRSFLIFAILAAGACTTWEPAVTPSPANAGEWAGGSYRITRRDGSVTVLERAQVKRDSIEGGARTAGGLLQTSIAIADITAVEKQRVSAGTTVLVVAAVVGLVAAVAGGMAMKDSDAGLDLDFSRSRMRAPTLQSSPAPRPGVP